MTRASWMISLGAIIGAIGAEAVPVGDSLELDLLKAAAGSGLIGLMLLWFVWQSRKDRELEREDRRQERVEAAKRECHLADRLNEVEDKMMTEVTAAVTENSKALSENTKALERFASIAEDCHDRNK